MARRVDSVSGSGPSRSRAAGEGRGDPGRRGPTDHVARGERAVDRGGRPERVADARVLGQGGGRRVAGGAERQADHRVADLVERDAGSLGLGDERADDVVGGPERDAAPDERVRDGRGGRVALGGGLGHARSVDGQRADQSGHHVERRFVDRDRVEQRRDAVLQVALVREREALQRGSGSRSAPR